jgi:hypothetical protein
MKEPLGKNLSITVLRLLVVVCLLSGAWGTSGTGTATNGMAEAVVPGSYTFQFRDALGDTLLSDGMGPYVSGTSSTCQFWFTAPCNRDLVVTGCPMGTGPHNRFTLHINAAGKCTNQLKIGETVGASALINLQQYDPGCTSPVCTDLLTTSNAQPYQTTLKRTGKNTWVWGATDGLFDHRIYPTLPPPAQCMADVVEQCPLTFEVTITRSTH